MLYTIEIIIDKPVLEVTSSFIDKTFLKKWQSNLLDYRLISGQSGIAGSVHELLFVDNGYSFKMTETLIKNNLPDEIDYLYESGEVKNHNYNSFILQKGKTLWKQINHFQFSKGVVENVPLRKLFEKQTKKTMTLFKELVEKK